MDILETANDIYKSHIQKQEAIEFLNKRGVSNESAKYFEVGFSPSFCLKELMNDDSQSLRQVGLLNERDGERNWKRLMFPIRDVDGKLVGFNGRSITDDNTMKYLLSPDYAGFFKSQVLYNLYQAKNPIKEKNDVYLVEGVFDVMALHQAGINNVVCGLGTALSNAQIEQLAKYTNHFTIMFDGDVPGFKAGIKNLRKIQETMKQVDSTFDANKQIKFVAFEEGHDPGDYLKKPKELKQLVTKTFAPSEFIHYKCSSNEKYEEAMNELNKIQKKQSQQLSRDVIKKVVEQVNIVDVVSDYVSLQKQGASYKALCPFPEHDEATPSFVVTPHKNICKCFGCDTGGNVISFVSEMENVDYKEAVVILKEKYNLEIGDFKGNEMTNNQKQLNTNARLLEFSKGFLNYLEKNQLLKRSFSDKELQVTLERNDFKNVKVSNFRQILNQCYKKKKTKRLQGIYQEKTKEKVILERGEREVGRR